MPEHDHPHARSRFDEATLDSAGIDRTSGFSSADLSAPAQSDVHGSFVRRRRTLHVATTDLAVEAAGDAVQLLSRRTGDAAENQVWQFVQVGDAYHIDSKR